jgi:signal transduction histidine kinase
MGMMVPAYAGPRRVLLLYSYEREFTHVTFAGLLRPELSRTSPDPIDFIEVSLQPARSSLTDPDATTLAALRAAFAGRGLDLVVPLGGPAASFAQKHRDSLFPATPVLFAGLDSRFVDGRTLSANETAVMVHHEPAHMVDTILRLLPATKNVVVVIGASRLEQFWVVELTRVLQRFDGRVDFVWTNQWSVEELITRCSTLPPHAAILYGLFTVDARGVPQIENQTLDALHASANAPIFGLQSPQFGHGIVGGPLVSIEDTSHATAVAALRLLRGEAPRDVGPQTLATGVPVYDARELRRWGIPENRLESGSLVRFRESAASPWPFVVAVSTTAAQVMLLIALTLHPGRGRRPAPSPVSDVAAAEAALSKLSQRLMRAQEDERAATARAIHDDVGQQLAALTLSLHALGGTTDRVDVDLRARIEDLCAAFWALERDILAISDPLYHRVTLLGLGAAARNYCARRCAEAGVTLAFSADGVPDHVPDAISIALFRVMEEAVGNALAYARSPRLDVTLVRNGQAIDLDVADTGAGFDANAALRRGALGLIGMRERMRLVGGTCAIASRPGTGTRVHARVPYSS